MSGTTAQTLNTSVRGSLRSALAPIGRGWDKIADGFAGLPKPVKLVLAVLGVVLAYALPILNLPVITTTGSDFATVLFSCALYGLVAVGLNIVVGYAGLLDLGYVGFYATGAYAVGLLTSQHGSWPYFLVLPIAMAATMVTGVILGAPTLRVRGDYLAIVTMGFGEIITQIINNTQWLGASAGINNIPAPPSIGPNPPGPEGGVFAIPHITWVNGQPLIDLGHKTHFLKFGSLDMVPYYWLALTALVIVLVFDYLVKKSRVGRAWEATREDEDAAEIMGVPTFKFKLLAFALGAAIGGLAGALLAPQNVHIDPTGFQLLLSELFVAAVIIGGSGNRWGALVGGALVEYLPERLRFLGDYRLMMFGILLVAMVIFRPQGIFPAKRTRRAVKAQAAIQALEEGEVDDA